MLLTRQAIDKQIPAKLLFSGVNIMITRLGMNKHSRHIYILNINILNINKLNSNILAINMLNINLRDMNTF